MLLFLCSSPYTKKPNWHCNTSIWYKKLTEPKDRNCITYLWRQINKLLQLASQWPLRLHLWYGLILLTRLCIHCKKKTKTIIIRTLKFFTRGVTGGWAVFGSLVMRRRRIVHPVLGSYLRPCFTYQKMFSSNFWLSIMISNFIF